ncbi:hypothetical protein F5Y19DRAFT_487212 [Xylariaceae sp. FL1651]|nr:hypothetical protein F5Y19DRAFT_487212 [Xylariaceae sp. FL1651]
MTSKGSWWSLPTEIRLEILSLLPDHISPSSEYAPVCNEWRAVFERANFRRLTLIHKRSLSSYPFYTPDLDVFAQLHRREVRRAIKHICLRIKLDNYDTPDCRFHEAPSWHLRNDNEITAAICCLFSTLGSWARADSESLTLEIDAYSPADARLYRHLVFGDAEPNLPTAGSPVGHGWANGQLIERAPLRGRPADDSARTALPSLSAGVLDLKRFIMNNGVTGQNPRKRLAIEAKLENLLQSQLPCGLRALTLFEDSNENYYNLAEGTPFYPHPHVLIAKSPRIPAPTTGVALAQAATNLERLSASFNVDAEHFFEAALTQPLQSVTWERLNTLVLTSRLLDPSQASTQDGAHALTKMLLNAATAAQRMPQLCVLAIWHGARGSACLFKYHRGPYCCSIQTKGTWLPTLMPSVIQAWTKAACVHTGIDVQLRTGHETVDVPIGCHGTAADQLGLGTLVAHPASLRQIQLEAKTEILLLMTP